MFVSILQQGDSGFGTVLAIVLGAALSLLGGIVNEVLARLREGRRAKREAEERRALWEREDKLRKEQQDREDQRTLKEDRIRAYQRFLLAASLPSEGDERSLYKQRQALREAYLEIKAIGSMAMIGEADKLYRTADFLLLTADPTERDEDYPPLEEARAKFWEAVEHEEGFKG